MLVGNNSCPPLNGVNISGAQKLSRCRAATEAITRALTASADMKLVVLSFFGNYFLDTDFAADHLNHRGPSTMSLSRSASNHGDSKEELFFDGLDKTISALETAGKTVVIVVDIPELPFLPRDKLRRTSNIQVLSRETSVPESTVRERQSRLRAGIEKLKSSHPPLVVYDPSDFLCDGDTCHVILGDTLVYRDSHHLSTSGSKLFAEHFLAELRTSGRMWQGLN